MSDTVYNKPLAMFMAAARADAQITIPNPPVTPTYPPGIKDSIDLTSPIRLLRRVYPMLPDYVSQWSQYDPYNCFCKKVDGKRGVVGCCPLAVGMLMAFYKHPTEIRSFKYDWDRIINNKLDLIVADFLEKLAGPTYLDSEYITWDDRETSAAKIAITFGRLGYGIPDDIWDADPLKIKDKDNVNEALDFMEKGYGSAKAAPLIIMGKGNDGKPHYWIMDGFTQSERYLTSFPNLPGIPEKPHLHMVWG